MKKNKKIKTQKFDFLATKTRMGGGQNALEIHSENNTNLHSFSSQFIQIYLFNFDFISQIDNNKSI